MAKTRDRGLGPGHVRWRHLRRSAGFIAAGLCLLASACSSGHQSAPPAPSPTATVQAGAPTAVPTTTPAAPTPTAGPSAQQLADLAAGKVLVQAQCAACHALADAGIAAAPSPVANPLDGIGARHGRAWLKDELRNACAHVRPTHRAYSCSNVHAFNASLTPEQRNQVIAYLLSLR